MGCLYFFDKMNFIGHGRGSMNEYSRPCGIHPDTHWCRKRQPKGRPRSRLSLLLPFTICSLRHMMRRENYRQAARPNDAHDHWWANAKTPMLRKPPGKLFAEEEIINWREVEGPCPCCGDATGERSYDDFYPRSAELLIATITNAI